MKNIVIISLLFSFFISNAQVKRPSRASEETAPMLRHKFHTLPLSQQRKLQSDYRSEIFVQELGIPNNRQEQFKKVYQEYYSEQQSIKADFNPKFSPNTLTDEEAKEKLEQSFIMGKKLIDNRKKFASEFLKIITPQQLLMLFRKEMMMRNKALNKLNQNPSKK